MKSITISSRLQNELELLMNGGYFPLDGFMNEKDYNSVLETMYTTKCYFFPLPVNLYITPEEYNEIKSESNIVLKDEQGFSLAEITINDLYQPDYDKECKLAYGSNDDNHPYVKIVQERKNKKMWYIGCTITKQFELPRHYDFRDIRHTPTQIKKLIEEKKLNTIVAFQTRNPMHKSHYELTLYALKEAGDDAVLLLQPVVGITQDCDIDYHTRVKCYKEILKHYPQGKVILSLLPLSMRMAGPKECLLHALIRKNYGATHFICGRDHAGPSYQTKEGNSFYGPYDAQKLAQEYANELGIKIIVSENIVYVKELNKYLPQDQIKKGMTIMSISGTQQRDMLVNNIPVPEWFTFPDVYHALKSDYNIRKGFCLYLVGLSGSGKSSTANAIVEKFRELCPERRTTILDADIIRLNLSKGLGFTNEDRSINVRRIGFVASEIAKHGGIVLVANIAPFESDRQYNRNIINTYGKYVEIYVNTSLNECENRDCKGLYKKARDGVIREFTGISSPFEEPKNAEIVLDESNTIEKNVDIIVEYCTKNNLL